MSLGAGKILAHSGPVTAGERIASLDVLRGVAVFGILIVNIQSFSMIGAAYFDPTAYGDLTGANFVVWLLTHVLADQKFMTIFSMLFGAGIVLMSERAVASGRSPAGVHYSRMFWLILFGAAHGYLLWYGDILYVYGACGLVAFLFWKLRPGWLLTVGLLALAVCSALWLFTGWSIQFWPPEQVSGFVAEWHPGNEAVAREVVIYQGGWLEQMEHRVPHFLEFQTMVFFFWGSWRAGGLMLVGMALFKLGVFSAQRSRGFYLGMVAVGLLVGMPVVVYGVYRQFAAEWDPTYSFFLGTQFNYWASILVSLAWVGIVMLACKAGRPRFLLDRLAAAGRMAFSLYILQTLICTTLFYGHGFGLFGRVERVGQIAIVTGIVFLQLWLAPLWLRRFRFGPLEWLWRTLTYRRSQPMRIR